MSARTYTEEEKMAYVEDFKKSNQPQTVYARENAIPESTFRAWLKEDRSLSFGAIEVKPTNVATTQKVYKSVTVFASEDIRIELKEGFNKDFLKSIVEVMINDR